MQLQFHKKDADVIGMFLSGWLKEGVNPLNSSESEPIYFDTDSPEELNNCFMELEREGFKEAVKKIFIGNHFYRSDTGKCPRCWRYRPEIHWNNENIPECEAELCDRCEGAVQ